VTISRKGWKGNFYIHPGAKWHLRMCEKGEKDSKGELYHASVLKQNVTVPQRTKAD
jgi:hypothetical protein